MQKFLADKGISLWPFLTKPALYGHCVGSKALNSRSLTLVQMMNVDPTDDVPKLNPIGVCGVGNLWISVGDPW